MCSHSPERSDRHQVLVVASCGGVHVPARRRDVLRQLVVECRCAFSLRIENPRAPAATNSSTATASAARRSRATFDASRERRTSRSAASSSSASISASASKYASAAPLARSCASAMSSAARSAGSSGGAALATFHCIANDAATTNATDARHDLPRARPKDRVALLGRHDSSSSRISAISAS